MKHARILCPQCEFTNVAEILWGYPVMNDELQRDLDNGKVVFGGCCIADGDLNNGNPQYKCNDYGYQFKI